MSTIKEIIETMSPEAQKEMFQELKAKLEERPTAGLIDQSVRDFVKAKTEAKKQIK